ncbi:hypothetical protein E2C01_089236 [Portunus trituberculatus]|uniref:Mutator-like transposase domain-containing protein n=1 Tax=Portunus trituberculatus TaxID=210409 RepID=A0A5B7JP09_PORTR|nr:hypothetical protein [Portunus trituberculatus]
MEVECALRLWGRFKDIGFHYTTILSDGDSSAYTSVTKMNDGEGPYSVKVVQEEYVNHVKKRMGTCLRKLKEELKEESHQDGKSDQEKCRQWQAPTYR